MISEKVLEPGAQVHGYRVKRVESLPDIQATFIELEHATGARHIHLERADDNHTFTVVFPTVPQDSTGVAHILEHIVLAGSQKYPTKDPFFSMISRSLNTFMNAFTSSDWTAYPFSTRNEADYFNLLGVYLDACFFPLLTRWTFLREGHRLEYADPADASSQLGIQGIVYNEMKGGMSSPSSVMYKLLGKALYPDLTYANNAGGDPEAIPDLTWDGLRAFHARHYHPSNAYFFTYGSLPLERHLEFIEREVLSKFERQTMDTSIPDQPRFPAPREARDAYPSGETEKKAQVSLAWVTVPSYDSYRTLELNILSDVLLGNAAAPLRKALIDSGLGASLADGTGFNPEFREAMFAAGLKDTDAGKAEEIEKIVLGTLERLSREGIPDDLIENSLHQLELSRKEVSNAGFPYSLKTFFQFASTWLYGGDPLSALKFNADLERLAENRQQPNYFGQLIRRELLENPHRVRVVLEPDANLAQEKQGREAARVGAIEAKLSEADKQRVVSDALELLRMQDLDDENDALLPMLRVSDIRTAVPEVPYARREAGGATVALCPQPTNGLLYLDVQLETAHLTEHQKDLLPIFAYALTKSGADGLDYLEVARRLEAFTGGIGASTGLTPSPETLEGAHEHFSLTGKALARNADRLLELVRGFLRAPSFDRDRLSQLLKQQRTGMQAGVVSNGSRYAALLAAAQLSPSSALSERQGGLSLLARLKRHADADAAGIDALISDLLELAEALRRGKAYLLVTAEQGVLEALELDSLLEVLESSHALTLPPSHALTLPRSPKARTTDVPVAYNAKVFRTVPYTHPDSPALYVLAQLLTAQYTLRELREKGGAYGGSAGYSPQSGLFTFSSYRDPHIERTFEVYRGASAFVNSSEVGEQELTEALIRSGGALDPLTSPDTLGRSRFFSDVSGYTRDRQEAFRARMVSVTLEDVRRVAGQYLVEENAAIALISSAENVEAVREKLGLEVEAI